jgi:hypothetical protein
LVSGFDVDRGMEDKPVNIKKSDMARGEMVQVIQTG